MGLLGKLAGGGFFGLAGMILSKKKKKSKKADDSPTVEGQATQTFGQPVVAASIDRTRDVGLVNAEARNGEHHTFTDAFRERAAVGEAEREARRQRRADRRAARQAGGNSGAVGRFK